MEAAISAAALPSPADWRSERDAGEGLETCEDGDNGSRNRRAPRRNGASPFHKKTFPKTVVILVLCLLLVVDCLASSPNEYRNRRTRRQRRLRSRLHREREELPQRASTAERPRQSRLLGLGHIANPFGMLGNSLVSSSELLFKLIDDSHPQILAGKRMDEDVKFDEDATQKIDEMEVASERPAFTQRPRLRMKKGKKVPAAVAARLTTTPSSTTALDDTTVASEDLPVEHRFGQGIDLEMADIVRDDIDLSVKNAEINRQRSRSRNRVRNQNGIAGGGRRNSGGAGGGEKEEVIKLKWRRGSPPPTQPPPSESTEKHGRMRVKYREEYPVIVCDDPNDCPTPIYDDPPSVYEFGGKKKKKKATTKIIPPARNVKQASRGKRPMSGEGRRRFKPFQRKKASPGGTRRRNDTMQQQSVSGGGENGRLVVPQRMRVKDFAKDEFGGSGKEAALKSKLRKKTMRRKMRPVAQTTTAATTTEENGGGGEIEMGTRNRDRPMRPPFRRRRPTTSPFVLMDGVGEEDLQVAEETTTQHVPLDMVLMRDMSLPELQQFMANKVKEMNKKMKRVMKGHMEPKGDSSSASRPRMKVATPAPTALASTTSYPAVPELDLKRTTSRGKKPNDNGGGDGKAMPARLGDSGVLFRDQLRIRASSTPRPASWDSTTSFPAVPGRSTARSNRVPVTKMRGKVKMRDQLRRGSTPGPTSGASTTSFPAVPESDKSAPLTLLDEAETEGQMLPTPDDVFIKEDSDLEEVNEGTTIVSDATTTQPPPTTLGAVTTTPNPTTTSRPPTRRVRTRPTVIRTTTSATTAPVVRFKPFNQSELFKNLENVDTRSKTTSATPQLLDRSTAPPFLKFKPFLQSDFFTNLQKIDTKTAAPTAPPFVRFKPFSKSELFSKFQSGGAVENNLDMVLKFMTKEQILGTLPDAEGVRGKEVGAGGKRPPSQGRPVSDLTLMSMGVQSDDDDAISAMMELTEFGLKNDSGGEGEEQEEQGEQERQRGMSKAKPRGRKKNDNLQTRRRPRPSRPSPTTTSSSTYETGKPSEKFPHYPSKTPYGSTPELPTSTSTGTPPRTTFEQPTSTPDEIDDEDVLADLELDLQAELDAIRKLQETIEDKEAEEESGGNMKLAIGGGKNDGSGGKRIRTQRPLRTRRPITQATRFKPFNQSELFKNLENVDTRSKTTADTQGAKPPAAEESERDEMSNVELQKVKAPATVTTTMKTRRPGVADKATTSRRPMLNARPGLEQSDTPSRNNQFMRRKKRPRPTKITTRQPTFRPGEPDSTSVVRFKPFDQSELFKNLENVNTRGKTTFGPREPDSTSSRPSLPSTTATEMSNMPPFTAFSSTSPPVSSSESPASSTPFTRFNSERNPADPLPTSFIRFEMMPHGPFFMSDLAEQSLADSMEEGDDDDDDEKLAELNLEPQRPTVSTVPRPVMPSFVPRRPMLDTPNIHRRPSTMERPDFHPTMSKMPEFTRPDKHKTTKFTRPEIQDNPVLSEPEILEKPANTRPDISSMPEFSMPNLPKPTETGRPALSKPDLPGMHIFPMPEMPKMPRPPMGKPSLPRPRIPSMPIPTRNRIPNPAMNGRPPGMSVPRPRPERPSISFVEMSRPTKSPVVPKRPNLLTHTSNHPHSSMFMPGIGKPAMNVPGMPHKPGPAMTSEMESFMEDVEGFTKRPLPKPNSSAIHFHNLLRPESQPSFEFAMENLMSMFEPTKSTGGLKPDAPQPPISSFASMNKRPFLNNERPSDSGSMLMGSQFVGNSDAEFQGGKIKSPIMSTSDAGGGNFMSFRFGPEGDSDEEFEFSTSLDLLDLRPDRGEIVTSTPHSTTTHGNSPSIMQAMPAFMADEINNDFMKLMFDEARLGEDKSKRTTPRPFDNPYMNYFKNEDDKRKQNEALDDDATPFTFSRRPTPTPFPTVEAFTVRIKPTGAPISVPTTAKPTLKQSFMVRPSSKPLGGAVQFRGHMMKNKRPPTSGSSSSSFQMFDLKGFAHRSTATPFHMSRPTRPKRKPKPLTLRPPFTPAVKKPFAVNGSKLDALRAKLQRLSKPKPSKTQGLPAKDITKPFKPSPPQFGVYAKRPPKPMTPFKMSPVDFNGRPRPLPPHSLKPIKPYTLQRPPPKKILPAVSLPPRLPTRPKMHPLFPEIRPTPASVVPPRPGVKTPFTVRPKSTLVPHNFVQPANIKKTKQPVKDFRPPPPPVKLSPSLHLPPKHKSKRPHLPPLSPLPPKPVRPHVPKSAGHLLPKPLQPLKPSRPPSMLSDLRAPEPASGAADFDFNPNIFDEQSVALKDPNSFDGPLFYGDANIKNLASPDRPPLKLRKERRPHDQPPPPPPPPSPSFKDSNSAHHEDDFDYLAALYDDYDHTLFPGQHDDRPPVSTFASGFDNFPKYEDEKIGEKLGEKVKSKLPSPNSVGKESQEAGDLKDQIHGPIESLLRDLPHTGGTPQDEKPEFPRGASGINDVIPSPATMVGSLPRPDRQREPFKGGSRGPALARPYFRPSSLVGMKPFQPGVRPSRNLPPRQPPLPITRNAAHPKLKLPKMDQELLGFISTIPGYMQKMMSNIGDNFTGRDLKAAVMRIESLKRRHDSKDATEDYEYDESQVEMAGS